MCIRFLHDSIRYLYPVPFLFTNRTVTAEMQLAFFQMYIIGNELSLSALSICFGIDESPLKDFQNIVFLATLVLAENLEPYRCLASQKRSHPSKICIGINDLAPPCDLGPEIKRRKIILSLTDATSNL